MTETYQDPVENPFDFDTLEAADPTPKEIRGIKYRGKNYLLRQASEAANIKFTNARIRAAKMSDGKLVALQGGAEVGTLLVSLCLYEIQVQSNGNEVYRPVSEQFIASWPPHIVAKLFEEAKRISHIDQTPPKSRKERIAELEKELAKLKEEEAQENPDGDSDDSGGEGSGSKSKKDKDDEGDLVGNSSRGIPTTSP